MYKFEPILKTLIWGSESWQLSGVPGSLSVVFEGPEKGKTVSDLLCEQHERLVGRRSYERYGDVFPLLIKFIEANLPLSVQVHPNDELARKRHNSFGKTEMWRLRANSSLECTCTERGRLASINLMRRGKTSP